MKRTLDKIKTVTLQRLPRSKEVFVWLTHQLNTFILECSVPQKTERTYIIKSSLFLLSLSFYRDMSGSLSQMRVNRLIQNSESEYRETLWIELMAHNTFISLSCCVLAKDLIFLHSTHHVSCLTFARVSMSLSCSLNIGMTLSPSLSLSLTSILGLSVFIWLNLTSFGSSNVCLS